MVFSCIYFLILLFHKIAVIFKVLVLKLFEVLHTKKY